MIRVVEFFSDTSTVFEINVEKFKTKPLQHQLVGLRFLLDRDYAALFDEQGSGKTKQIIDTACVLYEAGVIDTVLVVAPASVRSTWADPEFGEIKLHGWVPGLISEYSTRNIKLLASDQVKERERLYWVITNYEFIRQNRRRDELIEELRRRRVMMVCDEGSFIRSYRAAQTKATIRVRQSAIRAYLLNGTPIGNSSLDLFTQMSYLSPRIFGRHNYWTFRRRYCRMGGWQGKQIVGHQNQEELQKAVAPFVLRRLKEDCIDLPQKSYTIVEVPLTEPTWKLYRNMREDMIIFFRDGAVVQTQHAIVKLMRLEQLTSGYVGGLSHEIDQELQPEIWDGNSDLRLPDSDEKTREVSQEKLDAFIDNIKQAIENEPSHRQLVWCRFRNEQVRLAKFLRELGVHTLRIYGGQGRDERDKARQVFTEDPTREPMVLIGQQQSGGWGLNLQKRCWSVDYLSNDYNLITRLQSEDRVHRTGQLHAVLYRDYLATGPKGQKTINHVIHKALRKKEQFANWTSDVWRQKLLEE